MLNEVGDRMVDLLVLAGLLTQVSLPLALGALLIEHAGWRWVFLVNLPVCLAAVAWGRKLVPADGARPIRLA